ncbi:glycosyltransferase [Apilactobacillus timberlakei]|uniref:glycosyltransferase n=1 Tax=Apilactobacillus timberlakei TaxID=2008380 RepID=UPI001129D37C|nr:glycosyltransferase [Apilactobacillus timberlakei]TPR15043.1 glycosyltransferase [Apilactobacillus timberlakei]
MQFFLNGNFSIKNSGIEHAQIKRAKLFDKNNQDYKLVFKDWSPLLHYYLNNHHNIDDKHILNMFDYLQNSCYVENHKIGYKDVDLGCDDDEVSYQKTADDKYFVFQKNKIMARINLFSISEDKGLLAEGRVSSVERFDDFGNLYKVDFYDYRGFVSMTQWYTPDNKVGTETWYTPDEKPAIEDYYRIDGTGKINKSGWKLIDNNGAANVLSNMEELIVEFFNRINAQYFSKKAANIFIMDRSDIYEEALKELHLPAMKVLHLHNCHSGDAQSPNTSIMNNNYEYTLTNLNDYDAVISATNRQTKDVQERFEPSIPLFTIPVGIIPNNHFKEAKIDMDKRKQHSIVVTARVAPEKQIHKIIEAMGIAKKYVPDINLTVYGYIDHTNDDFAIKSINKMIDKYDLKDAVSINEYTNDVAKVQRSGQIYALASTMEGFNLAMMEAQSQGMVGVTHNVNYGPNELVVNDQNGYVVPFGDTKAMADKFVKLFNDPELIQKMSNQAYELSKRYSETQVYKGWQTFQASMDTTWQKKVKNIKPQINKGLEKME